MNRLFSISRLRLGKWKTEKPSYSQYRPCTEHANIPKMTRAELEQQITTTLQGALQYGQTLGVKKTVVLDPKILEQLVVSLSNGIVPICDQSSDGSMSKPRDPAVVEEVNNEIRTVLAQLILDELYAMLKHAHGALDTKPDLRRLVRWVAESYNIYPRALLLKGIQLYSYNACAIKASGGYGRVFYAKRQGCADVAVKCLFLPPPPPSGYDILEQTENSKVKGSDSESVVVVEAGNHLQFREGITWSCLEHPNVLPFLGYHDIVIERTSGLGLVSPWRKQGHIVAYIERLEDSGKKASLRKLFQDIAQGLTYLHNMSIAHGDLHAGNIVITNDGVAQIADLGTAKYLDNSEYTANSIRRAMNMWNCPEATRSIMQGYDYQPDPASDVYSFGCLWLLIHSRRPMYHPYRTASLQTLHIAHKTPLLPVGLKKGYTLEAIENSDAWKSIKVCLSDDPKDRPAAHELSEKLNIDSNWIRDWYAPYNAKSAACQWEFATRNDDRYGIRGLKIHAELNQDDGMSEHTETSLDSSTLGPNTPPEIGKFDMAF